MKHIIIFGLAVISLFLTGCAKKNYITLDRSLIQQDDASVILNTGLENGFQEQMPAQEESLKDSLPGKWTAGTSIYISGVTHPIFTSGEKLTYSGSFSISLPKELTKWSYKQFPTNITIGEKLSFSINDERTNFQIKVRNISEERINLSDKEQCGYDIYLDGENQWGTVVKNLGSHEIYLTKLYYHIIENPEMGLSEAKWRGTDLCFIQNNFVYTISVVGYLPEYNEEIIDSFHFF